MDRARELLETSELEAQWAAARTGLGIAALPSFLAERDGQLVRIDDNSKDLQPVKGSQKMLDREVWLAVHRDLRPAPAIRAVMDFIVSCFA